MMNDSALQKEISTDLASASEALALLDSFQIDTAEEFSFAEDELKKIKNQQKDYEKKRKSATDPINKSLKEINSWFKPVQNLLGDLESRWKTKLLEARARIEQQKAALFEAANEQAHAGNLVESHELAIEASQLQVEQKSTVRKVWQFEIVKENLIPREFLMPDEKLIRQYLYLNKEKASLPGIRFYQEESLSVRSK